MEIMLKYIDNDSFKKESPIFLEYPFTAEHIIFIDYSELTQKDNKGEITYNTKEYARLNKIIDSFYDSLLKHKELDEYDAEDMCKRLFAFYCLYKHEVEIYDNFINKGSGYRMGDYEKKRKAIEYALHNAKCISFSCEKGEVTNCNVHRATSGNKVAIEGLELYIFLELIHNSDIVNQINLHEGEVTYRPTNGVWEKLKKLALYSVKQTKPESSTRKGDRRESYTKQLAGILRPLYRFLIDENVYDLGALGKFSASGYIAELFDLKVDHSLFERYITRNK